MGRKHSIMFDSVLFITATIIFILAKDLNMILIGRYIQGHAVSSSAVSVPLYTSETSQPEVRKITGVFAIICYCFGSAASSVLGASLSWRLAIGFFLIPPAISFVILFLSPKSPVWLISCNRHKEAIESLTLLRGQENQEIVKVETKQIQQNFEANLNESETSWASRLRRFVSLLKDPTFLKPFSILLLLFPIGMSWSGLISIGFYMVPLLQSAQISMNPYWANAIIQIVRAIVSIFGLFFNKKLKRRPVYLGCCIMSCTGTLSLSCYYFWNQNGELSDTWIACTPIISIVLVYVAYGLGLGSIPIMLQGELLPSYGRSFGSGLIIFLDNISRFASSKTVPMFIEIMGKPGMFCLYTACIVFVGITCFFVLPETSGLTLSEIETIYKKDLKKNKA